MKIKTLYALLVGMSIAVGGISAYAAEENQATKDDETVVGACMVQKFKESTPAISQATIDKCADADANGIPKCLGISDSAYEGMVKFCVAQLVNAKCVSAKMKVTLIQYADCGYESDPVACYKALGYTPDDVVKLSTDCQNDAAN